MSTKSVRVCCCALCMVAAVFFSSCENSASAASDTSDSSTSNLTSAKSAWSISGSTFTHDPSIIYANGLYWMFYTADGIGVKYSSDGKTWTAGTAVFSSAPSWWTTYVPSKTDFNVWAPDIVYYNSKYYLYYSVSTFGSNVSCIGLVSCTSILSGDWTDMGMVIRSISSSSYNCIDPSFIYAGAPYLAFGSWYDGLYIVRLSSSTMKPNASPVQIADRDLSSNAIEGACIWAPGNGYYYLFASFDKCCLGTSSTYNICFGRSTSVTGPYYDEAGTSLLDGGGTVLAKSSGNYIGPGGEDVFKTSSDDWAMCYHYYDKANSGTATLLIKDLKVSGGWPSF